MSLVKCGIQPHFEFTAQTETKSFRPAIHVLHHVLLKVLNRQRSRQHLLNPRDRQTLWIAVLNANDVSDIKWHGMPPLRGITEMECAFVNRKLFDGHTFRQ